VWVDIVGFSTASVYVAEKRFCWVKGTILFGEENKESNSKLSVR
jgi:hypothetical protein